MTKCYEIKGVSTSGIATCLVVPELKVVLDIGVCTSDAWKVRDVLITHGHVDHVAGAVKHAATRDLLGMKPSRFILPAVIAEDFKAMMGCFAIMQQQPFPFTVVPLQDSEHYERKGLVVEAFATSHRIPSLGYALYEKRSKLKPEFVGMEGKDIGKLRKEGVEVTDTKLVHLLTYTGDTTSEAMDLDVVKEAPMLVMECTFVGSDVTIEQAREKGHIHLMEIVGRSKKLKSDHIVLMHFSMRHSPEDVVALRDTLPDSLRSRVEFFTGDSE
jgi:ribonuclease Z